MKKIIFQIQIVNNVIDIQLKTTSVNSFKYQTHCFVFRTVQSYDT